MANKYLYLLGAGASAKALPVVSQINPKSFIEFNDGHSPNEIQSVYHISKLLEKLAHSISSDVVHSCSNNLKYLHTLFQEHEDFTIDNICRYYFFQGIDTYEKLKIAMTQYFNLIEALKPVDVRYRIFFMNLLSNERTLPHNINILSWNYDRQISMVYEEIRPKESMIFDTDLYPISQQNFCEIKLNGSFTPSIINRLNKFPTVSKFVDYYKSRPIQHNPIIELLNIGETKIKFCWEKTIDFSPYRKIFQSYEELIIIGYSFPFYNRSIDNFILKNVAVHEGKRVTIQDNNPDDIIEKIESVVGKGKFEFQKISPTQFYIPEGLEYPVVK